MINEVLYFGQRAPQPEPDVVREDEAGADWERPLNQGPIAIFRRSPTYELSDYRGGFGVYLKDSGGSPSKKNIHDSYGITKSTVMFEDIIKDNKRALLMWIYSYLLQNTHLTMYFAIRYLGQIVNNEVEYPAELLNIIKSANDRLSDRTPDNISSVISRTMQELQLYIPRNFILPDLNIPIGSNIVTSPEKFLFGNIYWLRYFRDDKFKIEDITLTDLYLVTANPYERYPGRKLLSYYNDKDLYMKFGRLGKYFFPKTYSSKLNQIDGMVAMSLYPFGYFTVQNWSRPVRIVYHLSEIPLGSENTQIFDLDKLNLDDIDTLMPLLRLGIQIESSWPFISDKEVWIPFINMINSNANILYQEYLKYKNLSIEKSTEKIILTLPDNFESLEQKYTTCLLCEQTRSLEDFSYCGHGTCITCQSMLGTAKCPFCTEHFIAPNINDEFVRTLQSNLGYNVRDKLYKRIIQVNNSKQNRTFKFDWANGEVSLFRDL